MICTYIRWRDASHSITEWEIAKIEPCDLEACGFLVRDTDDAVTISIEAPEPGGDSVRLWMCIPKINIVSRVDVDLAKAFPTRRRRK